MKLNHNNKCRQISPRLWGSVLRIALTACFTTIWGENYALAEIIPDKTLGTEPSVVTPQVNINGLPSNLVNGGATRGTNLFHSFSQFNIDNGQRVYFANPVGIDNILTRVTGGNPSNILGTLGVDGGANLFLLNPNGIIFGENARLDIAGSFFATTANSLVFDNGVEFSATQPEAPPLLTINVPLGLQYGSNYPEATIANAGTLTVGQNLTLVADNLHLQGQLQAGGNLTLQAQDTVKVRDRAANPFIASAGGQLLVQGNQGIDIFALNNPHSGFYANGDLVLRSANTVGGDAYYWTGGNFRIEKLDGSLGNFFSPNDPIIRASGDVNFDSYAGASLHIFAGGSVNIVGNVTITGADAANFINELVTLSDGTTTVAIDGSVEPTLDIRAGTTAFGIPGLTPINPPGFIPAPPGIGGNPTSADITIGSININEENGLVFLTNQYAPNPLLPGGMIQVGAIITTSTMGNSGAVVIDSGGDIAFTNFGFIDSSANSPAGTGGDITLITNGSLNLTSEDNFIFSLTEGSGKSGDIYINAESVFLSNSAQIGTLTLGEGNGGNLTVIASEVVELVGNPPDSPTDDSRLVAFTNGPGKAGNLRIETKRLIARDGGYIYASTLGAGQAGDITVIASDSVELVGAPENGRESGLFAASVGAGDAGNIRIETGRLLLQEGGQVTADGFIKDNGGSAGNITIVASDSVELIGVPPSGKPTALATFTLNDKNAGDLNIDTRRLIVRDGAAISTLTTAEGQAGNLIVKASELVEISGTSPIDGQSSRINARTTGAGNGGNLTMTTGTLVVEDGGLLSASTSSTGRAGNLYVTATDSVQVIGVSDDDHQKKPQSIVL